MTGPRRRPAALIAAAAAVAMAGACGGGGDGDAERASTGATTSTSAVTTTAPAAAAPVTSAGRSGSTTATTRTARPASTPTVERPAPALDLAFTPAGTYRYATTGRFTSALTGPQARDGETVLTVDPPSGTDQRSVRRGFGRTTEQVLRLEGGDALLVSLRLTDQGVDKEVRPSPPALALPAGAAPGRTWAWSALSTDGRTTVDSSFTAVRSEDVTVGAERVRALVVEVVLTLSGDLVSTSRQTLWVSTRHRLVVRQDEATDGRLGLVTFSATSSDTLVSLTPG